MSKLMRGAGGTSSSATGQRSEERGERREERGERREEATKTRRRGDEARRGDNDRSQRIGSTAAGPSGPTRKDDLNCAGPGAVADKEPAVHDSKRQETFRKDQESTCDGTDIEEEECLEVTNGTGVLVGEAGEGGGVTGLGVWAQERIQRI
eukprot:768554-Hanusia_phi.AAC.6